MIVVRFAVDLVVGFESRADAERFLEQFRGRLAKFGLELHADKTRLRNAARNRKQRGEGKPETFTFLGSRTTAGNAGAMGPLSSGAKRQRSGWWQSCMRSKQSLSVKSMSRQRWSASGFDRSRWAITNTMLFRTT